jgi:hypothetical protein
MRKRLKGWEKLSVIKKKEKVGLFIPFYVIQAFK